MFIEIEGAEGAYKSSIIEKVLTGLKEVGINSMSVAQPGGTPAANLFRSIMKYGIDGAEDLESESLLYVALAARVQLMKNVVAPALEDGYIVISDRGNLSSLGLQGYAGGVPIELIESIVSNSQNIITSDMLFYVDIDINTSLRRQKERGTTDKLELMGRKFQEDTIHGMKFHPSSNKITKQRFDISGFNDDGTERTSTELAEIILEEIIKNNNNECKS